MPPSRSRPPAHESAAIASEEPILDAHVHVGRWKRAPYQGISTSLDDTIDVLGRCGIGGAVLLPVGPDGNVELADALRSACGDFMAWFFPWIAPGDDASLQFAVDNAAIVAGLKIHPSYDRCRLVDPPYAAALDAAATHGWPVLVHCGRWLEMAGWALVLEAAERHPGVRFILAHLGGDEPELRLESVRASHARGLANVWFESSAVREFWAVRRLLDEFGADWLMFGSDYNLHHPTTTLAALRAAGLEGEQRRAVFGGNLRALMADRPTAFPAGPATSPRDAVAQ